MTVHKLAQGTRSASILSLGTLPASTYIASAAQDLGAVMPLDKTIEVEADANGTPADRKQLSVFAKLSLDGTNWTTGPESGTSAIEEADLHFVGALPMNDTNVHRRHFSLRGLPSARHLKIVVRNEIGIALTSGEVYWADVTGDST